MNAKVNTGRRTPKEVHTADLEIGQRPDIIIPNDGPLVREPEEIVALDKPLDMDYAEQLAFAEEMVTIRLERSPEKYAPTLIDVYVNGVAKWLPVGKPVTIARKFVEVLARAKPDAIDAGHIDRDGQDPENYIRRYTSSKHPFSVLRDPNPRGYEWLTRVMAEA